MPNEARILSIYRIDSAQAAKVWAIVAAFSGLLYGIFFSFTAVSAGRVDLALVWLLGCPLLSFVFGGLAAFILCTLLNFVLSKWPVSILISQSDGGEIRRAVSDPLLFDRNRE